MPSPFPGMNPYIERDVVWHDFHERAIPLMAEMLGAQVLPRYFVRIDKRIYVREPDEREAVYLGRADVAVVQGAGGSSVAVAEPRIVGLPVMQPEVDDERVSFLEIVEREEQRVVTVIELVSPSNKVYGKTREQYLSKQAALLQSESHFVEIDLLRGGPRLPWKSIRPCDYCVVVSRVERRPGAELFPIGLREPLPTIPVPLHTGDDDASLDLQAVIHRIFDAAGYGYYVYHHPPEPPLSEADEVWAEEILGSRKQ